MLNLRQANEPELLSYSQNSKFSSTRFKLPANIAGNLGGSLILAGDNDDTDDIPDELSRASISSAEIQEVSLLIVPSTRLFNNC